MSFVPGYLPDPEDGRDRSATELLGLRSAPASASNRDLVPVILDQGGLGSCTANAVAYAIRAAMILAGFAPPEFISRLFLYYLARATHGMTTTDSGSFLRAIFQIANKFGFCPESVWSYDDRTYEAPGVLPKFARLPSQKAFRAAYDQHEPTEYRRIFETGYARIDVIKRALAARQLVVFGTDVSVAMVNGSLDGTVLKPPIGEPIAGGHAMAVAEYNGDDFGVPQSWGTGRGANGWMQFSADYLAWEKTRDLWIVRYAPNFSEAP